MAVPSRAFVGILVFALIATLAVGAYTGLVLSGYKPPPESPYQNLFPQPDDSTGGAKLVLVLATAFCVALVVAAWRGLVQGARVDRQLRAEREARKAAAPADAPRDEQPPGYQ